MSRRRRPGIGAAARVLWTPWRDSARAFLAAAERVLGGSRRPVAALLLTLAALLVVWFVYVPLHELLHAAGCVLAGGRVTELEIAPQYGGALLARVFPFVTSGGDYAGRLSGFDTAGSDLVYLATVALPYLLTVAGGHLALRAAGPGAGIPAFATGTVLLSAPLISLGGDFYEMGSVLVSAALAGAGAVPMPGDAAALRSDDLPLLLREFRATFPEHRAFWGAAVAGSALAGWGLATLTLEASRAVARLVPRRPAAPA